MSDLLSQGLQAGAGLDAEKAREVAAAVIAWGAERGYSGDKYYWPVKFRELSPGERRAAIRRDFNGRNLKTVCAQYGVSERAVYHILHDR